MNYSRKICVISKWKTCAVKTKQGKMCPHDMSRSIRACTVGVKFIAGNNCSLRYSLLSGCCDLNSIKGIAGTLSPGTKWRQSPRLSRVLVRSSSFTSACPIRGTKRTQHSWLSEHLLPFTKCLLTPMSSVSSVFQSTRLLLDGGYQFHGLNLSCCLLPHLPTFLLCLWPKMFNLWPKILKTLYSVSYY
jgi:hypothetical protein